MHSSPLKTRSATMVLALASLVAAVACTDTVYKERAPFNPPPDPASGFLGYYTVATKQTTCGNCHAEKQGEWLTTKHSHAWADLQNSGGAQSFCTPCHSISANGNADTGVVGYTKTPTAVYQDVQCESCHGPGETHVSSPTIANRPLARISVADTTNSCASCHSGAHDPFFEEWSQSGHGQSNTLSPPISNIATNQLNSSCAPCHEARTVLALWGVSTNYVEANDVITAQNALPIVCAVCHDPHDSTNPGQLRYPLANVALTGQLCIKCHSRRFDVTLTANTPHAPQGPVVLGSAGYWPPGYDTSFTSSSHGDLTKNPRLCAGCHVNSYQLTNTTSFSTGHLFRPIPCLVNGAPVFDDSCAFDLPSRSWQACTNAACHATAALAQQAFASDTAAIALLTNQLWVDANGNGKLDPFPTDSGYLAQVSTQVSTTDTVQTVADGVMFNVNTFGLHRYSNGDNSMGVHNPFLYQAILAASITAMKSTYGLSAPPPNVQVVIDRALARVGKKPPVVVSSH